MRHDEDRPLSRLGRPHATDLADTPIFTWQVGALPGPCLRAGAGRLRWRRKYPPRLHPGHATHLADGGSRRSGRGQCGADAGHRAGRHTLSVRRQHARIGIRLQRPGGLCLPGRAGSALATHFAGTGPGARPPHRTAPIGTGRSGIFWQQRQCQPRGYLCRRRPFRPRPQHRGHGSPGSSGWHLLAGSLHRRETRSEVASGRSVTRDRHS